MGRHGVKCVPRDVDRYGRTIAECEGLNLGMIREGWAVWYRRYAPERDDYREAQIEAQTAGRGMWEGRFDMPWDWRRGEREVCR